MCMARTRIPGAGSVVNRRKAITLENGFVIQVPMFKGWTLFCYGGLVLIGKPTSEWLYKTHRSLRNARVDIKRMEKENPC